MTGSRKSTSTGVECTIGLLDPVSLGFYRDQLTESKAKNDC